jgi:hypothetical protein
MIDREPALFGSSKPMMRKGMRQKLSCPQARSEKCGKRFSERIVPKQERPAAIRPLGATGKLPVT